MKRGCRDREGKGWGEEWIGMATGALRGALRLLEKRRRADIPKPAGVGFKGEPGVSPALPSCFTQGQMFASTGVRLALRDSPVSSAHLTAGMLKLQVYTIAPWFMWVPGAQPQVILNLWQVLYSLSHLPPQLS